MKPLVSSSSERHKSISTKRSCALQTRRQTVRWRNKAGHWLKIDTYRWSCWEVEGSGRFTNVTTLKRTTLSRSKLTVSSQTNTLNTTKSSLSMGEGKSTPLKTSIIPTSLNLWTKSQLTTRSRSCWSIAAGHNYQNTWQKGSTLSKNKLGGLSSSSHLRWNTCSIKSGVSSTMI